MECSENSDFAKALNRSIVQCPNSSTFGVKESGIKNLDGLGKGQPISNMKFSKKIKLSKVE